MNDYFFQPIDLPPLPERFVEQALTGTRTDLLVTSVDRQIHDRGSVYRNAQLQRWRLSQDLVEWLHQQGIKGFDDVSVQTIQQGDTLGPHTDSWQSCKLFYLLEPGGPNVETIWYQQPGHDLIREKFLLIEDTKDLEVVHRMVIPPRQWGFINVRIIHEVKNMTNRRETVVASFTDYIDFSPLVVQKK